MGCVELRPAKPFNLFARLDALLWERRIQETKKERDQQGRAMRIRDDRYLSLAYARLIISVYARYCVEFVFRDIKIERFAALFILVNIHK